MIRSRLLVALALLLPSSGIAGCGGDEFSSNSGSGGSPEDAGPDAADVAAGGDAGGDAAVDVTSETAAPDSGPLGLGSPCVAGSECDSEVCEDQVCCEQVCSECMRCDIPSQEGTCAPVPAGQDPDGACGGMGEPCSGACDGQGACSYPPERKPCGEAVCDPNGVDLVSPVCDGLGACMDVVESCSPYACDPALGACHATCEEHPEACSSGAFCDGTACHDKLSLGETCSDPGMCESDLCVDGVCCDGFCDLPCESCDMAGLEGVCTPFAAGEDPEGECGGDPGCAGSCDGASKCSYPPDGTSCGPSICQSSDNVQVTPLCDGVGACIDVETDCGLFDCDGGIGACLLTCSNHGACIDEAYCEGATCHADKDDGAVCDMAYQCSSGYCEMSSDSQKHCCNTECPSPMDCLTGECLCEGVTCPVGEACVPWFQDLDQDGYGDSKHTVLGCEGTPPKDVNQHDFVRNMDDCYDLNSAANPDQTSWFSVHRGDGSFDFDCKDGEEKEHDDTVLGSDTCEDCKNWECKPCGWFGIVDETYGYVCKIPTGGDDTCGPLVWQSFKQERQCGELGTLYTCNHQPGACNADELTYPNTTQRCR